MCFSFFIQWKNEAYFKMAMVCVKMFVLQIWLKTAKTNIIIINM